MQPSEKDRSAVGAPTLEIANAAPWGASRERTGKESAAAISMVVVLLLGLAKLVAGILSGRLGLADHAEVEPLRPLLDGAARLVLVPLAERLHHLAERHVVRLQKLVLCHYERESE